MCPSRGCVIGISNPKSQNSLKMQNTQFKRDPKSLNPIVSTSITSLILYVILPFRYILRRVSVGDTLLDLGNSVALYQGTVWHERRRPVHHSFRYVVRYALIDLDNSPRPPPNHLSADEAHSVSDTNGPVFLLTIPPSVGYEQNPLSLYYCYDVEGADRTLTKCIAEVTNTPWGERVTFLFNPNSDLLAKPLHVSLFMVGYHQLLLQIKYPLPKYLLLDAADILCVL